MSPSVIMLFLSKSGRWVGFESMMLRCGRQSPHFSSAASCKSKHEIKHHPLKVQTSCQPRDYKRLKTRASYFINSRLRPFKGNMYRNDHNNNQHKSAFIQFNDKASETKHCTIFLVISFIASNCISTR